MRSPPAGEAGAKRLRTMGENKSTNELYGVEYENFEYKEWIMSGLKMVERLDGQNVPKYLISN
ncbi:MAG: hypothetical protein KAI99_15725 [Cyclobacteriaceae bacterium]|nr:hypothetical protein [Cyclobacteriaceae bacterium]